MRAPAPSLIIFSHNLGHIKPISFCRSFNKKQVSSTSINQNKKNEFHHLLLSYLSCFCKPAGSYINKMSNAVASYNANRYRAFNNNYDCDILNQTYNFLKNNAESYDEISQIMMAYKKLSSNICGREARPKRRQGFRGFARKMYFKNIQ